MVEFLNSKNIKLDIPDENPSNKLPPLKKKVIKKFPVPHYPNIDVPMSEKEIMEFKKNILIELLNLKE